MRKPYYNIGAVYRTGFVETAFKVSLETSERRNNARKEILRVPIEIIKSALEKY